MIEVNKSKNSQHKLNEGDQLLGGQCIIRQDI
jgi:hypothetical protein